jgi:hypothetical protein
VSSDPEHGRAENTVRLPTATAFISPGVSSVSKARRTLVIGLEATATW